MNLIYRKHAIIRMFERGIRDEDIRSVLLSGEVIADYPNDTPYPSRLILGWPESRYFCRKIFSGILLEKIGKNYATAYAFGGPDSSASPRFDPARGRNIGSRMT